MTTPPTSRPLDARPAAGADVDPPRPTDERSDARPVGGRPSTLLTVVTVAITLYLVYLLRQPITWLVIAAFIALALSAPVGTSRV